MTAKKKKSRQFSRSLYVSKGEYNIRSVRPGYGMHPKYLGKVADLRSKKFFYLCIK